MCGQPKKKQKKKKNCDPLPSAPRFAHRALFTNQHSSNPTHSVDTSRPTDNITATLTSPTEAAQPATLEAASATDVTIQAVTNCDPLPSAPRFAHHALFTNQHSSNPTHSVDTSRPTDKITATLTCPTEAAQPATLEAASATDVTIRGIVQLCLSHEGDPEYREYDAVPAK